MNTKVNGSGSATHGNSSAPSFLEVEATETEGKKVAMAFLNYAIDGSGMPRKQVADHIGKSEPSLSKMTTGLQAFGIDDFENLPHDIQVNWIKRYGHELGLEIREIDAVDLAHQVLARFDELSVIVRLLRVRPRMAKVRVDVATDDRRRA
jgi:hypothetical protein